MLEISSLPRLSIAIANAKATYRGRSVRFGFDQATGFYFAEEDGYRHMFGDLRRGLGLYKKGLSHRARRLWSSYCLDQIELTSSDVVIDCGANYADLWLTLREMIEPQNYVAFEPARREYKCILMNAPNARANDFGLGMKNETLTFYVNEQDADSSFIEPVSYSRQTEIPTIALESYLDAQNIDRVKLFKLEAEGFEPEILEGARPVLKCIDYVAIDGGNERGVNCEQTFTSQSNLLFAEGFEMIDINFQWGRALFRNRNE